MKKRVLNPERLRKVPPQFSWIDHRLVQENHFARRDHSAWTLYLFLASVADAEGLSYYSEASLMRRLNMDLVALSATRRQLIQAGLIAYEKPFYQVLSRSRWARRAPARSAWASCCARRWRSAMIDYQTYCQIRQLFTEKKLGLRQIARELKLGLNTVCKWARRESFERVPIPKRATSPICLRARLSACWHSTPIRPSIFSNGSKNRATRAATRSSRPSCAKCVPSRDRLS